MTPASQEIVQQDHLRLWQLLSKHHFSVKNIGIARAPLFTGVGPLRLETKYRQRRRIVTQCRDLLGNQRSRNVGGEAGVVLLEGTGRMMLGGLPKS